MAGDRSDPKAWQDALATAPHPLPDDGARKLQAYVEALHEHGRAPNLTALKTVERIVEVLLQPSLLLAWATTETPTRVADVGTGNGFPGIVAAALWPDAKVCLIERRARKANAVRELAGQVGFDVEVLACDARELAREGPQWLGSCDLVTLRAVGDLVSTTRITAPLLARGGRLVHWKTDDLDAAERAEAAEFAKTLGLTPCDDVTRPALATARLVRYQR